VVVVKEEERKQRERFFLGRKQFEKKIHWVLGRESREDDTEHKEIQTFLPPSSIQVAR